MRLNLPYLAWGLRRALSGRTGDLAAVAASSRELCPAEIATIPPAIHAEGALDRVRALSPWRNWETERLLAGGGRIEHAPTIAHLVEDVALSGAHLYKGAAKAQPGFGPERPLRAEDGPLRRIEAAHLVSNWAGSAFFGNHMLDDMPLGMLPPEGEPAFVALTNEYGHAEGYRALFALPRPPLLSRAWFGRLTFYADFAQNSLKAARYRELRRRMRAALAGVGPAEGSPAGPGVYLKRGATGEPRLLANEAAVEARLRDLGFDVVEPAALDAAEIARRTLDARIVIGVEGSHLSHAIYTIADDGAFLVLQPPDRFALPYKEFADRLDLPFAFVVGSPAEGGFTVDPDEIERMIGRLA